jgi:aminoglycoside 3'-phosphotransferase-1
VSDFDDERNGWPVEQVWKEMHKLYILTGFSRHHGEISSLITLFLDEGKLIGCIDVGRAVTAD